MHTHVIHIYIHTCACLHTLVINGYKIGKNRQKSWSNIDPRRQKSKPERNITWEIVQWRRWQCSKAWWSNGIAGDHYDREIESCQVFKKKEGGCEPGVLVKRNRLRTGASGSRDRIRPGTDATHDSKYFRRKIWRKYWRFLPKLLLIFCKNVI
jgi:hypothetical protein